MNRKSNDEQEKEQFYTDLIKEAQDKKIIIYGASAIGKAVFGELRKREKEVLAFCVTDKQLNVKNVEQVPVWQFKEISKDFCKDCLFVIAMKPANQVQIEKLLESEEVKYIKVPESMCNSEVNLQRVYIPGMEITTKIGCSVNCRYCPQDTLCRAYVAKHKETVLSLENFKCCLDKTPQNTLILFSGFVEPFLNPECIDMMEYSVQTGHRTLLNTTLVGMTKEQAKRLVKLPIEQVVLHTPDVDGYAQIPMTKEYFEVLELLLNSKKENGKPFVDVANCQSIPHPDIIKFIDNRISFSNIVLVDRAGNLDESEIYENVYHAGSIICTRSVILNRNVLLPDGTVVLCCMDFGLQHELGNLLNDSYEEIVDGAAMEEIRKRMKDGGDVICRKCSYAKTV